MQTVVIRPNVFLITLAVIAGWLVANLPALAQQNIPENDYRYGAVTWMQNSAEYRLLTEQTYRYALSQLTIGTHDRKWSADEFQIQRGGFEHKPPAVILDLDETVLDNSYYNARNIVSGTSYTTQNWNDWCKEEKAETIPGALGFVKAAEGLGVTVYYLTNREDEVKDHTVRNLNRLGFAATDENVLTKNEVAGRGDDKLSRRAWVADKYRVVLLIGDSMSDLCEGMDMLDSDRRNVLAGEKTQMLGSRWIMLPNPSYGSWQRALPKGEQSLELKQ